MPNVIDTTIRDLVDRSRLGDQVASATLAVIGTQARQGIAQAVKVQKKVLKYIEKNPEKCQLTPVFGVETPPREESKPLARVLRRNLHRGKFTPAGLSLLLLTLGDYAVGILVHGPVLLGSGRAIIDCVRGCLTDQNLQQAFDYGNNVTNQPTLLTEAAQSMTEEEQKALSLGMILGRARRLQAVSYPLTPLRILNPIVAWELGDDR